MRLTRVLAFAVALFGALAACSDTDDGGSAIERDAATPTSEPGAAPVAANAAAAGVPGAVRWGDILAPVDAHDGRAIEGATLVHFPPSGKREVLPLQAEVRDEHLAAGSLLAIDSEDHEPRFFEPSAVAQAVAAKGAAEPTTVELLRATRLVLEPFDDWSRIAGPYVVTLRTLGTSAADTSRSAERDQVLDAAADLRHLVAHEEDADSRRRVHSRVRRDRGQHEFIGIDGPPVALQMPGSTTFEVAHLPFVIGDLPPGEVFEIEILAHEPTTAAFESPGDEPDSNTQIVTAAGPEPTVVVVRATGGARILAQLPSGATEGTWQLVNRGERTNGAFDSNGALTLDRVVPGDCRFTAEWIESDGAYAFVEKRFDAPEQGVFDLGELSVAGGFELRVVPRVFVDGERDATVEAELAQRFGWSLRLVLRDSRDFECKLERLVPLTIRGSSSARGRMRGVLRELEADHAFTFSNRGFTHVRDLDLTGSHEVHLDLALERLYGLTFTTTVLPSPDGTPRTIDAILTNDRGASAAVRFERGTDPDPSQAWTVHGRVAVNDGGAWRLDVAAFPEFEMGWTAERDFVAPLSWTGHHAFDFGDRRQVDLTLELTAGSAVVIAIDDEAAEPIEDWGDVYGAVTDSTATFHPLGEPSEIARIHQPDRILGANIALGLRPGVEYVSSFDPKWRFVAPPAGETLHLER